MSRLTKTVGWAGGLLGEAVTGALVSTAAYSAMIGNQLLPRSAPGFLIRDGLALRWHQHEADAFATRVAEPPQYLAFEISPSPPLNRSPPFQPH